MSLTKLLCLGARGQTQENESTSLPNTERTEELGGAVSSGRGRQKCVLANLVPGLYSGANLYHKVDSITKTLVKSSEERTRESDGNRA